jgi:hypothetical protein
MISVLVALLGGVPSIARAQSSCTGPFSLQNQQPLGCLPYPDSLWNKPLPQDVMSHLLPGSDSFVHAVFTQDDAFSYPWTREGGGGWGTVMPDGTDSSGPLFYGQATDPVYVIQNCSVWGTGIHDPRGRTLHAPSGAQYSGLTGDRHIAVWDQTTNLLFSSYGAGTVPDPFPTCPGLGHAGTQSDPCPAGNFEYCAISDWSTDPGFGIGGDDSLGSGGFATHIRDAEIMSGHIPHAIYLWVDCAYGASVFPQSGGAEPCPSGVTNRPPLGAHFFLDYSPSQLADIQSRVPQWQFAILEALTIYGGYFGDTNAYPMPGPGLWGFEGAKAYLLAGIPYPLYDWLKSFPNDSTNGDPSQPLACYSYGSFTGCDLNPYVNVPFETGPNCPSSACDISQHMHIADPCIALGLAGQPGGCVTPGTDAGSGSGGGAAGTGGGAAGTGGGNVGTGGGTSSTGGSTAGTGGNGQSIGGCACDASASGSLIGLTVLGFALRRGRRSADGQRS